MNLKNFEDRSVKFANLSKTDLVERLTRLERALEHQHKSDRNLENNNLIHELEVHQVELEMQNRELRDSRVELEKTTERLEMLYDYAPVGYCTTNLQGTIRQINNTAKSLFGHKGRLALGKRLQNFINFEPGFDLCKFLQSCHGGRAQQFIEGQCVTRSLDVRSVQIISLKKPDYPNAERQVLLAFVDQTAERIKHQGEVFIFHASEVMAHSVGVGDTTYQAMQMAESMSGAIVMLDTLREGASVRRHVGDGRVATEPKTPSLVVEALKDASDSEINKYIKYCKTVHASGVAETINIHTILALPGILDALRNEGIAEIVIAPLYAHGRLTGVMSFLRGKSALPRNIDLDQTLIRFARIAGTYLDNAYLLSAAQKSAASRKQLLAVVSHDLRSPLCAIRMRSERLLAGKRASKEAYTKESAQHIIKYAERMDHLVGDLLDVSIVESGALSMNSAMCSVADIIAELLDVWQLTVDAAGVRLVRHTPTELWICADRERLLQAAGNIIGNAIKFTPPDGKVIISVTQRAFFAHFTITDTGVGIAAEKLPYVFNKFWQAKNGDRKGIGLGLSIAKGIVEAAGGKIWMESRVGQGTDVHFLIPLWGKTLSVPTTSTGSVLIIEDNTETATMVKEALEEVGNHVDIVGDGFQALEFLAKNPAPKIILLDLQMPVMDGWQFLKARRDDARLSALRVVVYSSEQNVSDRAAQFGAEYLSKSCHIQHLLEKVG